jgi:hypothetical protein
MFAILIFEREPLRGDELWTAFQSWVQDAGGFAALALLVWCLVYFIRYIVLGERYPAQAASAADSAEGGAAPWSTQGLFFVAALACAAVMYGLFVLALLVQEPPPSHEIQYGYNKKITRTEYTDHQNTFLTAGGAFALLAAGMGVFFELHRFRLRRIWAIARLRIKEAVRRKILWVFSLLILVFLFAGWFLDTKKAEFQLRNYVWVVDWAMTILLLLAASLLAGFSIHTDVKSQTIHTVVTKPVERFEIVLGTFLGYTLLMTGVLVVMTSLSLLYVARGINKEAAEESYKARVPIYGEMGFKNTTGENVGREWTHRKYISGPNRLQEGAPHYAIWTFPQVPERLSQRVHGVTCEFGFDIYRTHKNKPEAENQGVLCTFLAVSWRCPMEEVDRKQVPTKLAEINNDRQKMADQGKTAAEISRCLAEKYGYFELFSVNVTDYHTQKITLPSVLFTNPPDQAAEEGPADAGFGAGQAGVETPRRPALQIIVNVNQTDESSRAQLVGVAKHDLYLLDDEKYFEWNFFKASFGLWCRLCLIIGLAVVFSTYLSGIISWMCTMTLFGLGLVMNDIKLMTMGLSDGGGPLESTIRLFTKQGIAAPMADTPAASVAQFGDEIYRHVLGFIMKLVPDVNRFDLSRYVSSGFDISGINILLVDNLIPLLGFLVPWFVLSFYLMKFREVANPS